MTFRETDNLLSKEKKLEWRALPYEPIYQEYHPCIHRWLRENPQVSSFENIRYVLQPISSRNEKLAEPLIRRLLNLWLLHGHILPPRKRAQLLEKLFACGFTEDQLQNLVAEENRKEELRKRLAEAGPFDVFDEHGNLLNGKGKKRKRKTVIKKKGGEAIKKGGKKRGGKAKIKSKKTGKGKKKAVKGKKKAMKGKKKVKKSKKKGSKGIKKKPKAMKSHRHRNAEVQGEDEEKYEGFNAGKEGQLGPGWVQNIAMQLIQIVWSLTTESPDETFLSRAFPYYNVQATVMLHIVCQAMGVSIPDENECAHGDTKIVLGCLNLVVWLAKKVTGPAQALADADVAKLLTLRGGELKTMKKLAGKNQRTFDPTPNVNKELVVNAPRRWTEQQFPAVKPVKIGTENNFLDVEEVAIAATPTSTINYLPESSLEDEEFTFRRTAKWYDPRSPEFMYDGPHTEPKNLVFLSDDGNVKWQLSNVPDMTPQFLTPKPIKPYYLSLRPRLHPGNTGPDNFNFNSWLVMSDPECYQEVPSKWSTAQTAEQVELVFGLVNTIIYTPKLSLSRLLELVAELCEAIKLTQEDEEVSIEDQMLDDKRTIVLERIFLTFFGSKFRDYNKDTADFMRTICQRGAVLLRYLYQHTAWVLWNLQQSHEPEPLTPPNYVTSEPEADSPAIQEPDPWLTYLIESTRTVENWRVWLKEAVETDPLPEDRSQLIREAENWLETGENIQRHGKDFSERYAGEHESVVQTTTNSVDEGDWESEE